MPGFYSSADWLAVRRLALKRDHWRCVLCRADVHGKGCARVDHIKPRKEFPALALVLENLRTLCARCDNARHAEKGGSPGYAQAGAGPTGWPSSPSHPWNRPRYPAAARADGGRQGGEVAD